MFMVRDAFLQRPRARAAPLASWTLAALCLYLFGSLERKNSGKAPRHPSAFFAAKEGTGAAQKAVKAVTAAKKAVKATGAKAPAAAKSSSRQRGSKKKKKQNSQTEVQDLEVVVNEDVDEDVDLGVPLLQEEEKEDLFPKGGAAASHQRVALLIDGESAVSSRWASLIEAARTCGDLEHILHFGEPTREMDSALQELGITSVPVPKKTSGKANPNDMAMAIAAARLVTCNEANHIAMAVKDTDYLYMAEQLRSWGSAVTVLLPGGGYSALAEAFEAAKAKVVWYADDGDDVVATPAKVKGMLDENGNGLLLPVMPDESAKATDALLQEADLAPLLETLKKLKYINDPDDPLVPAFAKFAFVNGLGKFPVWPSGLAQSVAVEMHSKCDLRSCKENPGNLALILPQDEEREPTAAQLRKFGSDLCARLAMAGLPVMEKDDANLVARVLRRLGYGSKTGLDLGEAVDVFYSRNAGPLEELQIPHELIPSGDAREDVLRGAFLCSKGSGAWNIAPDHARVTEVLVRQGYLGATGTIPARSKLFEAMQKFAEDSGLQPCKSYMGTLHLLLCHLSEEEP